MKSFVSLIVAVFCASALTVANAEKLTGSADRKGALYKVGEPITFTFLLTDDNDVPLRTRKFTIDVVGDSSVSQQVTLTTDAAGKAQFATKLDKPGFVRCDRTTGAEKKMGVVGAGTEPEKILPAVPKPADFDGYWHKTVAELDAMPVEPKVVTLKSPDPEISLCEIEVASPGGEPVRGYLAFPRGAKRGTLPAQIFLHSAGVYDSNMKRAIAEAKLGRLSLDANATGVLNGQPPDYYKELAQGKLQGYAMHGLPDLDNSYRRRMLQRLYRSLQFLKSRPEWDGKILIAAGGSQGGWLAVAAAALDPAVTCCVAHLPGGGDCSGYTIGRDGAKRGWLVKQLAQHPNPAPVLSAMRYLDTANFATNVKKADCLVSVGFIDDVVCASSVYAMYNSIASPNKRMINNPTGAHFGVAPHVAAEGNQFVQAHIEKMRAGRR